jgi:DNA-binding FadR family transcriptional regulator
MTKTQVNPVRLPAQIAEHLMERILDGRLQPGARLPTEQKLCETFGVSRNVVREAISRLRSDGLVQARQGVGAFVSATATQPPWHIDLESLADAEAFRMLFELRAILEIEVAALAAERATAATLDEIERSLEMLRQSDHGTEASVDADIAFHRAVAAAAGNSYVSTFVGFVAYRIKQSIVAARRKSDLHEGVLTTLNEHTTIYEAIRDRDKGRARETMRTHIQGAACRLDLKDFVVNR